MKFSTNVVIQILALVAQAANATMDLLPSPKAKAIAAGVIALAQGISAALAHWTNPDGSDVTLPYEK
jgi:hypothetical protein